MTTKQTKPVFSRPPDDEAELDAWAESFVNAVLDADKSAGGEPTPRADDDRAGET